MPLILPLALLAASLLTVTMPAQTAERTFERYTALVEGYRAGSDQAIGELASWQPEDVTRVVAQAAARGTGFAETAALLHARLAVDSAASDWARGEAHLSAAAALVQSLPPDAEPFAERFYAFVPSLFLAHGDVDAARVWADRGLQLFEYSAPLRTMSGIIEEMFAHVADPECTGVTCAGGSVRGLVSERLQAAEREYRRALQRDPNFIEAELRLGRVLALAGRAQEAASTLTRVIAGGSPRHQYLAHLFSGALAVRQDALATARREYEAAAAILPGTQTPLLALGHLEESVGNPAKARALLTPLAQAAAAADPWWSYQNGGVDAEMFEWLLAYIRR